MDLNLNEYDFTYVLDPFTGENSTEVIKMSGKETGCVPLTEGNKHYAIYQAWLVAGNTPNPAE